jgi:hypothetical protein
MDRLVHKKMMGYRKKNRLEIGMVSVDDVADWLGK